MPIRLESILILSATILVFNCIMILYDNDAYAQVDNNTLESVAVPAGISEGVAQINTGESPIYIYGQPYSPEIYVANAGSDTVSVINTTDNTVRDIPVGISPVHILADPFSDDAIYVANYNSGDVSIINTTTNTLKQITSGFGGFPGYSIPVGESPVYMYGDPDSPEIYVANTRSDTVSVINTTDNTVKQTIHFVISIITTRNNILVIHKEHANQLLKGIFL